MALTTFSVATEQQLDSAIASIDAGGANAAATAYTITLTASITLDSDGLDLINLESGASLTIQGQNHFIDGGNDGGIISRGLFVQAGTVTVNNLTIQNAQASGGAGGGAVVN